MLEKECREKAGYFGRVISYESGYLQRLRPWKHIDRSPLKVLRYSFSQTIPMFSIALKVILSFSDRHKIFITD